MHFYKAIKISLVTSFLCHSILPSYATHSFPSHAPLDVQSQEGRTAAGILHYALREKEIYIILGRRDDSQNMYGDWCNFGGGSEEPQDKTPQDSATAAPSSFLWEDAARESKEETNGLYCPHPQILRHHPFIDVLTEKQDEPFLYRLYWQQVQYMAPKIFKEKLESANQAYNQEFTDFIWVKSSQLLEAVRLKNPLIQINEAVLNIYLPLFETLSTVSGQHFLAQLSTVKTLNTKINKSTSQDGYFEYLSIRPYFNQVYRLHGNGTIDQFYPPLVNHPVVKVSPTPLEDLQKRMLENRQQDAQSSKDNLPPNIYETIELVNAQEKEIVAQAVSAHGMAMVELKRRFAKSGSLNISLGDSQCPVSISQIHLRLVLGADYKCPEDFLETKNPQRQADLANIKAYFNRYTSAEYEQKKNVNKGEFKREIQLLESDYEFFADVLAFEEENKNWPTFYHGATQNINNLVKSLTYLRELISLKSFEGLMALRGSDIYFKGINTVEDLLKITGDCESDQTKAAMIFLNFTLFAGPETTISTSSSAEYVLNDHSVGEPDIREIFLESLSLAGFSEPVYDYFQSLFDQYYKYQGVGYPNSLLLAISQTFENIDTYNYASKGGGTFNQTPSTLQVLHHIQNEFQRLRLEQQTTGITENFEKDSIRKKELFPENRLLLHPSRVMNPNEIKIKAFDRFPLSSESQAMYDGDMRRTTVVLLGEWLAQHTFILEGSFIEDPDLKKLHRAVTQGITGQPLQESFSSKGLIYLIQNGHLEPVKKYIKTYPEVLREEHFTPQKIIPIVLKSNDQKFIDYFVKDLFRLDLSNFFTPDELLSTLYFYSAGYLYNSFIYLLKRCDLSKINDSIKLAWVNMVDLECPNPPSFIKEYLQAFHQVSPHLMDEILNIIWQKRCSKEVIDTILDSGFSSPQALLNSLGSHIYSNTLDQSYLTKCNKLISLLERGADLKQHHPLTQEPVAFLIKDLDAHIMPQNNDLFNGLLDLKNSQGLTLLQAIQKDLLEKGKNSCLFDPLKTALMDEGRNYISDSYPPFIETFSNLESLDAASIFYKKGLTIPENKLWAEALQQVANEKELQNLIDHCPSTEIFDLFFYKIIASDLFFNKIKADELQILPNPSLDYTIINNMRTANEVWCTQAIKLINEPSLDLKKLENHIDQVPIPGALYKFFSSILTLGDQLITLLPRVLEKLYPERETFISVNSVLPLEGIQYIDQHPLYYTTCIAPNKHITEILITFLGIENIPLIKGNLFKNLMDVLSSEQLEQLYEKTPEYFTQQLPVNHFMYSMLSLPMDLKRKIIFANLDKLKEIEEKVGMPYFWFILGSDANFSLVEELVEQDASLLYLKNKFGLDFTLMSKYFPKNKTVSFIQDCLSKEKIDRKTH